MTPIFNPGENPFGLPIPYLIDGEVEMTESVAMCQYLVEKYGPTDLKVNSDEADFHHYLNWLAHSDATLTFQLLLLMLDEAHLQKDSF